MFHRAMVADCRSTLDVGGMSGEDFPASNLDVMTTGLQPFSISLQSPGFQLLARVLMTPQADLGRVPTLMPDITEIGGCGIGGFRLLQAGTNIVFQVQILSPPISPSPDGGRCDDPGASSLPRHPSQQLGILELCRTNHEVK